MPKRRGGRDTKTRGGGGGRARKHEYGIQAILLADSYECRFRPLTLDRPKALLPVAGAPMINYALDLLAHSGIEEIFVVITSHAEMMEAYLRATPWWDRRQYPNLKTNIVPLNCTRYHICYSI